MSVAAMDRQSNPWRIAVASAAFALLFSLFAFVGVAAWWLLNWTYGEETMIGIGANAVLITPRLILIAIGSVFGVGATLRLSDARLRDTFLIAVVIGVVMILAIVNWRRFLSEWYSDTFAAISLVEVVAALIIGAVGGMLGSVAVSVTRRS
jgi:hypothetical protein